MELKFQQSPYSGGYPPKSSHHPTLSHWYLAACYSIQYLPTSTWMTHKTRISTIYGKRIHYSNYIKIPASTSHRISTKLTHANNDAAHQRTRDQTKMCHHRVLRYEFQTVLIIKSQTNDDVIHISTRLAVFMAIQQGCTCLDSPQLKEQQKLLMRNQSHLTSSFRFSELYKRLTLPFPDNKSHTSYPTL